MLSTESGDCPKYDVKELVANDDNKLNVKSIVCTTETCTSVILNPLKGTLVKKMMPLPYMHAKGNSVETIATEELDDYWRVDDMYNFENVGFSNTVGTIKYLTCADCEVGPIGWNDTKDTSDKNSCYVSLSRVKYV